ncbi:MAG: helix-turn-helix domain-containing protein [Myxococcales bacterium]|nr:helix-turn-helix domain-containing protein [Myxococcales bacterium]
MTAAHHIHVLISAHLDGASRAAVAGFLGMKPQQWGRYLNGHASPKESQINKWLALCVAVGIDIPATVGAILETPTPTQPERT